MHRTEAARTYVRDGIVQHQNQQLPTGGTTVSAEFMNSVQEEICNTILYAGLTIESDSTDDYTNGRHQLRDAIFNSEAITDAAISDMSLEKLTSGLCDIDETISTNVTSNLTINSLYSTFGPFVSLEKDDQNSSPTVTQMLYMYPNKLVVSADEDGSITGSVDIRASGIKFEESDKRITTIALNFSGATWADQGSYWSGYLTSGLSALTTEILSVRLKYEFGGAAYFLNSNVSITDIYCINSGDYWRFYVYSDTNLGHVDYSGQTLIIDYVA